MLVFFFWECIKKRSIALDSRCRFDAVIISSEVGYEKPDANIFKSALGTLHMMGL